MEPRCIIAGAGEYYGHAIAPRAEDYVIAADAGYLRLREMGVRIDEVIGDFDSTGFTPNHPNLRILPVEKDDTDMLCSLRAGIQRGYREFHLYGGTGGRLDHTLANIQCLAWLARQGLHGCLYGDGALITAVYNDALSLGALDKGTVSVFALGTQAEGVSISDLKYSVNDITLSCDYPLGVSNEFIGLPARIAVRNGSLLIVLPDRAELRWEMA